MRKVILAIAWAFLLLAGTARANELVHGILRVSYDARDAEASQQSMRVLDAALAEFSPYLPPGEEPIRIIIAHTFEDFAQYAARFGGLQVAGLARPADGLIAVKGPNLRSLGEDYSGTLRHELVHVLLYRNVDTDQLPKWLNEGLCMSLANEYHWESMLSISRMFIGGRMIEYRYLDLVFLNPGSEMQFGDAYAQALSMTRALRNRLGEDTFWAMIRDVGNRDFAASLEYHGGFTVLDFWSGYQRSLWGIAVVGTLVSGSVFAPISILVIIAYFRKRASNRKILRRWEREEREAEEMPEILSWDDIAEDPDAWKER